MGKSKRAVERSGATKKRKRSGRQSQTGLGQQSVRKVDRAAWLRLRGKHRQQKASRQDGRQEKASDLVIVNIQ